MDKILEAVVTSSYPASVKQGLVRRVLEAARQPLEREQCLALLALGARLYVGGADELPRRVGCQLLHVAGRHHPDVFAEFFSARRVLRLLQGGAGPPGARALACVQLGLQLLPEGTAADEVFALLRREVLRTVCERPGPAACAQVARLLARHPRCVPDGPHRLLFCQQLVRCLGRFRCPAEGEEGAVEFLEQAQQVSGLLAQLWRAQPAAILPCLKELFAVISCTEEEPPSSALASVVQHLPLELMDGVVRNLSNDDSVTDSQMLTAISRMIDWVSWPLGKNIDKWIIALLKGLAAVKKFSILIEVSLAKIEKVFSKLLYPIVRGAALSVLKYMLLTFQHSHEAFHLLLPHIPPMVASLLKEDSNSGTSCLEQLAELVHCMVFRFPGFPDLYEPVMEAIKDLHVPNEDRIKQLLGQDAWTSQKSELAGFYPRLMAKSDTGKIGLINLGNTCYVNSILQALFMASDFRHCVLRLTENNSQPLMTKLQWLFAFLEHSQRPAISPENFLSASWTPWFSPGTQQDCSEYLKYLLDRLHEEEKTGTRICQKLKQSSSPSPPEEPPSPSSTSVEKMFGGKIVTRICCLCCLNVSSREEAFTDLSLAFPPPERCRRRRLGSVMVPAEDIRAQELPPAARAQVASPKVGPRRQRKLCITGDAPPTVLDSGGLDSPAAGEQGGQEREEERKEERAEKEEEVEKEEEEEEERTRVEEEEKEKVEEEKVEKEKEAAPQEEEEAEKEKEEDGLGSGTSQDAVILCEEQTCGPEGSRSVLDLVNYFLSPERLTAENRYYCECCASLQDAEKVVELSQGPRYLILTLLRFSFDLRTMRRRKILDDVAIPLLLRLPLAGGRGQAYDLCSVVVHSGVSSESGHYYCYAREGAARPPPALGAADRPEPENQWYLFNDTRVSFSSFESVSNVTSFFPKDTAYVLFYRQRPGEEAELGSPRVRAEPTLHKDLMEAISKDNILYLQEQEKEARSRAAYISALPASPRWGRGFDEDKDEDEGSPGGCNPAGGNGGDFHRLVF
ncbi:ubiquitin carboxyl-terminal hydrolase 35 isoform X2 [Lemur catta]|nr:ubiquitin carboxyl-terminal hydrolase 35 isoform X2 [Lemur catta]XP_045413218.1 ubiquitin carboxyl-terminal hydrolase 35 isoform X2 [Lemur catta]XP_045413219.1 ubiquitin carboxyl-terminal hydrolase 35 isoform X2 [Lemur catta]XP_045413220.1 ubiquitin carboxyl-terminal hydrolase 35 isoform X2 [Lemur catta]XP_045413221.1 ubiquitin carboxyl-terminal hydrolase 35 isoform X2 [Lemur catta]XP_045413222.1 ubiquitin carboxyl-terminal hydrolase 35 isoform X2 [Lemur catta]